MKGHRHGEQDRTLRAMAMGKRKSEQVPLWIPTIELPVSPGHPFYVRLNEILDAAGFDQFVEEQCRSFYAPVMGRPSLAPGRYFRLLLVGYFEGPVHVPRRARNDPGEVHRRPRSLSRSGISSFSLAATCSPQ
jgi:hypothetical protein